MNHDLERLDDLKRLEVQRLSEPMPREIAAILRLVIANANLRSGVVNADDHHEIANAILRLDLEEQNRLLTYLASRESKHEADRRSLGPLRYYGRMMFGGERVFYFPESPLADFLIAEFGWHLPQDPSQVSTLDLILISILLRFRYHIDRANTEPARQEVLREIAAMKTRVDSRADRHLFETFRRALNAFPEPAMEVGNASLPIQSRHADVPRSVSDHLDYLGWGKSWGLKKLRELESDGAIEIEEVKSTGRVSLWRMRVLNPNTAYNRKRTPEP